MPRLFIAIDMPEHIQDEISDLYCAIHGTRWVPSEHLHMTLRFIGEADNSTENRIIDSMERADFVPFTLSVASIGYFPLRKDPQVLWVGVNVCDELLRLQSSIERTLVSIGVPPETRNFHPHVTIGRLDEPQKERVAQFITENHMFKTDSFEITDFHLYRSYMGRNGAQYVKEASFGAD